MYNHFRWSALLRCCDYDCAFLYYFCYVAKSVVVTTAAAAATSVVVAAAMVVKFIVWVLFDVIGQNDCDQN